MALTRMGGHFLRLHVAVDHLVKELCVVPGSPPQSAKAQSDALVSYYSAMYVQAQPDASPESLDLDKKKWELFFEFFNAAPGQDSHLEMFWWRLL